MRRFGEMGKNSLGKIKRESAQLYKRLKHTLTSPTGTVAKVVSSADRGISAADRQAHKGREQIKRGSERVRIQFEGLIERMPLENIDTDGDITSKQKRAFRIYDLSGLTLDESRAVVAELHELEFAFKVIWEASVSGTTVADHVSWLLSEKDRHREKFAKSPIADKLDTLLNWYLEMAESIRRNHRTLRTLLVLPREAEDKRALGVLAGRRLGSEEEQLILIGFMDQISLDDDSAYKESLIESGDQGALRAATPDLIDFFDDGIRTQKQPQLRQASESRKSFISCSTLHCPPDMEELKSELLPLVTQERRAYLSCTIAPVPKNAKGRFITVCRKRAKRKVGLDRLGVAADLAKAEAKYYSTIESVLEDNIHKGRRLAFAVSPLTLVIKSTTASDLRVFRRELVNRLNSRHIWVENPDSWAAYEESLYRIFPVISRGEVDIDYLAIPTWDMFLERNLVVEELEISRTGVMVGAFESEEAPGAPLTLDLGIYGCQGAHGSGKSMAAKVAAAFFPLANPDRRVIVLDNGAANLQTISGDRSDQISQELGWVQWARRMNGVVIYASHYKTPADLISKLKEVEDNKFIVYYPERGLRKHDLAFLKDWLIHALMRFAKPWKFSERDMQQMLVLDDIQSWNADPEGEDNRMAYLTQDLWNQCISTGTLAMFTIQTAQAINRANPGSHDVVVTTTTSWLNFASSGHGDVADSIGMRRLTREGDELAKRTTSSLAGIVAGSMGSTDDPGRCVVTMHNVRSANARVLVHPQMLPLLSRKVVR